MEKIIEIIKKYTVNYSIENDEIVIARLDDMQQERLEKELECLRIETDSFAWNNESETEPTKLFLI